MNDERRLGGEKERMPNSERQPISNERAKPLFNVGSAVLSSSFIVYRSAFLLSSRQVARYNLAKELCHDGDALSTGDDAGIAGDAG
jgi:hypothetical protein